MTPWRPGTFARLELTSCSLFFRLRENFQEIDDPKARIAVEAMYKEYRHSFCYPSLLEPKRKSTFGKILRRAFSSKVRKKRLGPAGEQASFYVGIVRRKKSPQRSQDPEPARPCRSRSISIAEHAAQLQRSYCRYQNFEDDAAANPSPNRQFRGNQIQTTFTCHGSGSSLLGDWEISTLAFFFSAILADCQSSKWLQQQA